MRKPLSCFIIVIVSLVSSCISLEEKIKNAQAEITIINPTDEYIIVKMDNKNLRIRTKEDTKITKGGTEVKLSDLSVGDKVDISYVSIRIKEDTKITKGGSEIELSDLSVGDKVDISYEGVKTLGLWDFGGLYEAKTIKVLE